MLKQGVCLGDGDGSLWLICFGCDDLTVYNRLAEYYCFGERLRIASTPHQLMPALCTMIIKV
jgi:hypothetical protein